MTIEEYEPKNVFKIFSEICAIPHGSGNEDGIRVINRLQDRLLLKKEDLNMTVTAAEIFLSASLRALALRKVKR